MARAQDLQPRLQYIFFYMLSFQMENLLLFSSLIFITNTLSAYYKHYFLYSILFFCLTITSVIFHYHTTIYTNIMDKIFIFAIVLYGGHLLYKKTNPNNQYQVFLIIFTFLLSIFFYRFINFLGGN